MVPRSRDAAVTNTYKCQSGFKTRQCVEARRVLSKHPPTPSHELEHGKEHFNIKWEQSVRDQAQANPQGISILHEISK